MILDPAKYFLFLRESYSQNGELLFFFCISPHFALRIFSSTLLDKSILDYPIPVYVFSFETSQNYNL